ncbi:MAG TPA: hypothetical protein VFI31_10330 [Pirellulales bacterium]|nr:hypothetical protein [Pirellulales bacterium]
MNDPTPEQTDDADAAALDETWSAFCQLLGAGGPQLDEGKLVRHVDGRLARRRANRRAYAALALAASVVLAVSIAWWPQEAGQRQVARAKQPARSAAFDWYDDLSYEIKSAAWTLEAVQSQARGNFDRARWLQQEMDELERELELSSL